MNQVIIGFGSNIEAKKHLSETREQLSKHCRLIKESQFIETRPIGNINQANFTNGVFLIETPLSRADLTKQLKAIELLLGRKPSSNQNNPRTVDLDIVVWNQEIVDEDIYRRTFLKNATLEVCPELVIAP